MDKLLVICGATATGKTKLAVDCAEKLKSEVVSADSQLIYKGLDIGTAKPDVEEMRGIKHHMIDIAEPSESFSVSDYVSIAEPIIENILKNGKTPVVCGGTGFYINSLLFDLSYGNAPADKAVREKYSEILNSKGKAYLHSLLESVDSQTAEKLHPNDTVRVIRALEIYEISGKKKSEINDAFTPKHAYLAVAVDYPRDELYDRINRRVDVMFDNGLVEEVESLVKRGITEKNQCMQAIGYKEVLEYLKNSNYRSTMRDIIKQNTRRYAKRQITFFKKLKGLVWLSPEQATADYVLGLLNG